MTECSTPFVATDACRFASAPANVELSGKVAPHFQEIIWRKSPNMLMEYIDFSAGGRVSVSESGPFGMVVAGSLVQVSAAFLAIEMDAQYMVGGFSRMGRDVRVRFDIGGHWFLCKMPDAHNLCRRLLKGSFMGVLGRNRTQNLQSWRKAMPGEPDEGSHGIGHPYQKEKRANRETLTVISGRNRTPTNFQAIGHIILPRSINLDQSILLAMRTARTIGDEDHDLWGDKAEQSDHKASDFKCDARANYLVAD